MIERTKEIEYHSKILRDVPLDLEVIVKEDVLRLGLAFTDATL